MLTEGFSFHNPSVGAYDIRVQTKAVNYVFENAKRCVYYSYGRCDSKNVAKKRFVAAFRGRNYKYVYY